MRRTSSWGFLLSVALLISVGWAPPSAAEPVLRFEASGHVAVSATGNTLGLAGLNGVPSANDGIGIFIAADSTATATGWPQGTTAQWALNGSEAELDLPANVSVLYAELVWGGSRDASVAADLDGPVVLTTPSGLSFPIVPGSATTPPGGGGLDTDDYYGRSAEVTTAVEGPGRYRVSAVPATLDSDDAAAGWSLMVVYTAPDLPARRVGIIDVMESVGGSFGGTSRFSLGGLCTPAPSDREARVIATAFEGDANISGDSLRFAHSQAGVFASASRIAGLGRPLTNVFGSAITGADGALDLRGSFGDANHAVTTNHVAARQGWDLAHIDATDRLDPSEGVAWLLGTTSSDYYSLLAVALQFRQRSPRLVTTSAATPTPPSSGETVQVTVAIDNGGDRGADVPLFSLVGGLPAGVSYVLGSLRVDGALPPGGSADSPSALRDGVALPDLPAGGSQIVTFSLRVDAVPAGAVLVVAPRLDFELASCNGDAPADRYEGPPLSIPVAVCGDASVEGSESCDDGGGADGDGCSARCQVERGWTCAGTPGLPGYCTTTCGDGLWVPALEACDDGDGDDLDGCSALCEVERGWSCEQAPGSHGTPSSPDSRCESTCGDGRLALGAEACDDGDGDDLDGCSALCEVEPGWTCEGSAGGQGTPSAPDSTCGALCGDGRLALGAEACDDGDAADLDGCSAGCAVEHGWSCTAVAGLESTCQATCGDGLVALGVENCDDGNGAALDGCSPSCHREWGWSCGLVPGAAGTSADPETHCVSACGDGKLALGAEGCDDGGTSALDGCSALCEVEPGWSCEHNPESEGTHADPDSRCGTICGDGLVGAGGEGCDDGGTVALDGCSPECAVEYGWICDGPPGGQGYCRALCGDGQLAQGVEACDDGNGDAGDGCDGACQVEPGWSCAVEGSGPGTPSAPDSLCGTTCGDGLIGLGAEECDDNNTLPLDGCDGDCAVERGWRCEGAAGASDHCASSCGDGLLALGAEACDDGNTDALDGCSPSCEPEVGWSCVANPDADGTAAHPDSRCAAVCGDGLVAPGAEGCDDGNSESLDGCSELCALERGWGCPAGEPCAPLACGDGLRAVGAEGCDDGGTAPLDGCSPSCEVEPGWDCVDSVGGVADSSCEATCGDGRWAEGAEGCDDGGLAGGDGCGGACEVEPGWACAGAPGEASACGEVCGDGQIVGSEPCDDGGALDLDGCAGDCGEVEHGWSCEGAPSRCATECGDGLIGAEVEVCDDGNRDDGDGCAGDCASVDLGWSCGDPPGEPSVCAPECGDGLVLGGEGCDDGGNEDGDGCSADCRIEAGWRCDEPEGGRPSECLRDRDEDGVPDDGDGSGDPDDNPCAEGQVEGCDDNCPDYDNPGQRFPSGEDETPLCPPYRGPVIHGGGGGCQGGGGGSLPYALVALAGLLAFARRQRRRSASPFIALALLAAPSLSTSGAHAQQVDPRLFDAALSPTGVLSVESSLPMGHMRPWVSLVGSLANDELVSQVGDSSWAHGPLHRRLVTTLALGLGLLDRLDLAVALPMLGTELGPGAAGEGGFGFGDLRLVARGRLMGPAWGEGGLGVALSLEATLPTGSDSPFMSDGGVGLTPRVVVDYRSAEGTLLALNIGYRLRPRARIDDLGVADELKLGLGAELPLGFYGISFTGELIAALGLGESALDGGGIDGREAPAELLGGLRWRSDEGLVLSAAVGAGVTAGYGAPDYRAVLGVSFRGPRPATYQEPLVPGELVELPDALEPLSDEPPPQEGTVEGGPAQAELPPALFDQLATADPDADADGVPTPLDRCPGEPEDLDGFEDEDGCPDLDNDGDGVADLDDRCPAEKEVVNGVDDEDGCPDEGESAVAQVGGHIEIADKIQFKSGGAELTEGSKVLLDQVAAVIRAHPEVGRIRIEGHTDSLGDREFNVDLAERRAWSVRAYLVGQGVRAERLFAKGYGSTRPIASNRTKAGRAKNRRVAFEAIGAEGAGGEGGR